MSVSALSAVSDSEGADTKLDCEERVDLTIILDIHCAIKHLHLYTVQFKTLGTACCVHMLCTLALCSLVVPRPFPVSNVARKKQEGLGSQITCASGYIGELNRHGRRAWPLTAKRA